MKRAAVLLLAGALPGCQQILGQDPARCDQSVATVRQALELGDFAAARQWRDYTWKVCDERAVVATLDKEIIDGEAALEAKAKVSAQQAKELAQSRINAAQKTWLEFDAAKPADRKRETLDATRKSAKRLENGLTPTYASKLEAYNLAQYEKRLAALGR